MRNILIILILSTTQVYAQDWQVLIKEPFDYKSNQSEISPAFRAELIKGLLHVPLFERLADEYPGFDTGNFYFHNFDQDDYLECIYFGFAGAEGSISVILDNDKTGFRILGQFFGKVVSINSSANNDLSKIQILEGPCCANIAYHLTTYLLGTLTEEYLVERDLCFISGTVFPEKFTMNKHFKTLNETYRLRLSPEIDNTIHDPNSQPVEHVGNISAEFAKDSRGTALAEHIDSTGRVWWFVKFEAMSKVSNSIYHDGSNHQMPFEYLGWTSSRYIEELN